MPSKKSLTPDQLFQCRVGLALGLIPSEVVQLGVSDYDLLRAYWSKEPWGPYRDNLHTAIIAREIRRGNFKGDHLLEQFMVMNPEDQEQMQKSRGKQQKAGLFGAMKAMAVRVPVGTKIVKKVKKSKKGKK